MYPYVCLLQPASAHALHMQEVEKLWRAVHALTAARCEVASPFIKALGGHVNCPLKQQSHYDATIHARGVCTAQIGYSMSHVTGSCVARLLICGGMQRTTLVLGPYVPCKWLQHVCDHSRFSVPRFSSCPRNHA